jgi:hypothetical protein
MKLSMTGQENGDLLIQFNSNSLLNKVHKFNYTISNGIAHQASSLCKCSPSITKDIKYINKNK